MALFLIISIIANMRIAASGPSGAAAAKIMMMFSISGAAAAS